MAIDLIDIDIINDPKLSIQLQNMVEIIEARDAVEDLDPFTTINLDSEITGWFETIGYINSGRYDNTINKITSILHTLIRDRKVRHTITPYRLYKIYKIIQLIESGNSLTMDGVHQVNKIFTDEMPVLGI